MKQDCTVSWHNFISIYKIRLKFIHKLEQLSLLDFPDKIKMREREKERERIAYVVSIKFFLPGSARFVDSIGERKL